MEKKIKRFQRLATLRKRDISKEITNSNLLENEINKNKNLIEQINMIIKSFIMKILNIPFLLKEGTD